jgi:hypothetical protein
MIILGIVTPGKMTDSIRTIRIIALSITILRVTTLSIIIISKTSHKNYAQNKNTQYNNN